MNIINISVHATQKIFATIAIVAMVLSTFAFAPFAGAAGGYVISGSLVQDGLDVTASGVASANPYTGQGNQQYISINWDFGGPSSAWVELADHNTLNFVGGKGSGGVISDTNWSSVHTYPSPGTYTIKALIHHQSPSGAEAGEQVFTQQVTVTYACSDGVDNDDDGDIDYPNDIGCTSAVDDDEFNEAPSSPVLTLAKTVVNDNGGTALDTAWTLTATGPTSISGTEGPSVTNQTVTAGTYDLSESGGPSGYTPSTWSCTDGTMVDGDTVTLADGDVATCTVTNDDIAPKLTVTKVVVNDSGTGSLGVGDFPLFVGATSVVSGVENSFNAGVYTVSETGDAGYTGTVTGDCALDGSITLLPGDVKACTITNDDVEPDRAYITVVKNVTNDDGGTLEIGDFPLFVNGTPVTSGVAHEVFSAGNYTISETNQFGYTAGDWGDDCAVDGSLTGVVLGGSYTCTITNDDVAPSLTINKVVVNDDETAEEAYGAEDFALFADEIQFTHGVAQEVTPGTYTLSETGPTEEYNASYSCVINGGDAVAGSEVTLAVGDVAVCTITNDDLDPTHAVISFIKSLITGFSLPDANLTDFDFNLYSGDSVIAELVHGDSIELEPGVYTVEEVDSAGYDVSFSGACESGTITVTEGDLGDAFTCTVINTELPACANGIDDDEDGYTDSAEDEGCTDEDDDSESDPVGSITIDKVVTGEDADGDEAFTFDVSWQDEHVLVSGNATPTVFTNLASGSYTIEEINLPSSRWEMTDVSCWDTSNNEEEIIPVIEGNSITVNLTTDKQAGTIEDIVCTFTNEYTPRDSGSNTEHIVVRKEVTEGSDQSQTFTFNPSWSEDEIVLAHNMQVTSEDLTADEVYSISEAELPLGWSLDDVLCTSSLDAERQISPEEFVLNDGETVTCVFTNDQDRFVLDGRVWNDDNRNGVLDEDEDPIEGWTVRATNGTTSLVTESDANGYYVFNVPRGTWTITQDERTGWVPTFPNDGSYVVTVPELSPEYTLLDTVKSFFVPTAHAAVVDEVNNLDFGNDRRGGGGGGTRVDRGGDVLGDSTEGEVLGEATSTLPVGAPNTGKGGSAPLIPTRASLFAILVSGTGVRRN